MRPDFQRKKRKRIGSWPDGESDPGTLAERVRYIGSPEHKDHPSDAGPGHLRSHAYCCPAALTEDAAQNTQRLREGIRRQCVSATFESGFPKYVWVWMGKELFEARHINGPLGTYKGYRLEPAQYPEDPDRRLEGWS